MARPRTPVRHLIAITCLFLAGPAGAADRVALLIGNSDYRGSDFDLKNPENDARALAAALGALGFDVTTLTNGDAAAMRTAVARFGARARGAETALFFYAGHGVQFAGDNLLIGTGFETANANASGLRTTSISMREVKDALEDANPGAGLILLDACRDTPIDDKGHRPGLVRTGGGAGLLLAYATDPGNVAYDGDGQNSIFTRALLEHVATPGLDVRLMLGRVRQQVVIDTFGQQVPWVEEALIGDIILARETGTASDAPEAPSEIALWRDALAQGDRAGFDAYLAAFPDGLYAEIARSRLRDQPSGTLGAAAGIGDVWGTEPGDRLSAALEALGYMPAGEAPRTATETALSVFRAANPATDTPEALYAQAGAVLTGLAAATAQQLRTDLVALRSVDRTLRISNAALAEIEEIAAGNASAAPILAQAYRDVEGIRRSRLKILARLDQSRSYYADLVTLGTRFIGAHGPGPGGKTIPQTPGIQDRIRADARLYLTHVGDADPTRKGSYSWLADFLRSG